MSIRGEPFSTDDEGFMRLALRHAAKGFGATTPNPLVGAVLVRNGEVLGAGWHKRAGQAHAEVNALNNAHRKGFDARGATLYVTLEPCSTVGRTPACTSALISAGVSRVVVGATDPNPKHRGAGFRILRKHGLEIVPGILRSECQRLNEAFNHWIVHRQPFVLLKSAMSLDGKIATNSGESQWITSEAARKYGMRLRLGADAILCGINTALRDDPALTLRRNSGMRIPAGKQVRRIVLDSQARLPLKAKLVSDNFAHQTIVVVSEAAPPERVRELEQRVRVMRISPAQKAGGLDLKILLQQLGAENITSLLVEGGGETHAYFLEQKLANRIFFFYAPVIISGRTAPKAVAGEHSFNLGKGFRIQAPEWEAIGPDLLFTGKLQY